MIATYIYINQETFDKLNKIKQQKKLSISTIVNIIIKHYQYAACLYENNYKEKGTIKLHLKIRDKNNYPSIKNDILATNSIYEWMYKKLEQFNYKKADSEIQSEMDKTIDPYYNYNQQVRNQTRAIRENKAYYKRILNQK